MRIWLTSLLVFLVYLGFHTGIALAPKDKLLAPYIVCFAAAAGILLMNAEAVRFRLFLGYLMLAMALLVMAVITSQVDDNIGHHILSSGIFLYSMVIAFGTFVGLSAMGLRKASKMFFVIAILLIAGSSMERYGGLKPVTDAARNSMDAWRQKMIYNNDLRDINLYGGVRPTFLASEPSILGISTGYAILFWFLAGRKFTFRRISAATMMAAVGFIIVRSPTILVCWLIACMYFASELGRSRTVPRGRTITVGICALVTIFVTPFIVAENTAYGLTASFYEREIGPPLITAQVLSQQPLFGTGFGGSQQLIKSGKSVYAKAGGDAEGELLRESMGDESDAKKLMASQFWELWLDLGLVGGILILWMLWRFFGTLSVPNRFLVFTTSALIFTMSGGLVAPGAWIGLFSIAALYRMHHINMTAEAAEADA